MDINSLFPSNFLKAADLEGQARRVTIASCAPELLGQGETKPVLRFAGIPRGLVLNRTNAAVLAAAFGTETTQWAGQPVELYPDVTMFQGRATPCIRVRTAGAAVPFAAGAVFPAAAPPPPPPPAAPLAAAQPMPFAATPTTTQAPPAGQMQPTQAPPPEQAALPLDTPISW